MDGDIVLGFVLGLMAQKVMRLLSLRLLLLRLRSFWIGLQLRRVSWSIRRALRPW